uniref:Uncharacterized protein n=1 Tax=Nelumbo nucifera TaxID=4432 RepID=A0A822YT13_NELNU|nr:TPA_asm: hypothetical protein HUJ06_012797 [Nelumbo nucifera]
MVKLLSMKILGVSKMLVLVMSSLAGPVTLFQRARNAIAWVKDTESNWVHTHEEISNLFVEHFKNLFTYPRDEPIDFLHLFDPIISDQDNCFLIGPPLEEVKQAVFSIGALVQDQTVFQL